MARRKNHKKSLPPVTVRSVSLRIWEYLGGPGDEIDGYLYIVFWVAALLLGFIWLADVLLHLLLKIMGFA